jgi:hypothetical protein
MPDKGIRTPTTSQRLVLCGRTGTGKTVAGLWHLSNFNFSKQGEPWVIIDFKNDDHVNSIPNLQQSDFEYIPTKKDDGVFIVHPLPQDCKGKGSPMEVYLTKLWEREHIGIFIDEGYVIGDNDGLNLCLTQGRSKRIPMIVCTQRPVWISRFAFSEADFIQCFHLNDERDRETVERFTPLDVDDFDSLKKYQSFYYDVAEHKLVRVNPVPDMDATRKVFADKLTKKRVRL